MAGSKKSVVKKTAAKKPIVKGSQPVRGMYDVYGPAIREKQNVASLLREIDAGLSDIQKRIYSLRERP